MHSISITPRGCKTLVNVSHQKKMSELQRCFGQQFRGDDELRVCKSDSAVGAWWEIALTLGIFMKGINHARSW